MEVEPGATALPVIYLLDDEPMVLDLAEQLLHPLGCYIRKFRDPEMALEQYRSSTRKPDLIISDYDMGTMDGLKFMDECRRIQPGQKVLMMSGTVGREVLAGRSAIPNVFIAKPFNVKEFALQAARLLA